MVEEAAAPEGTAEKRQFLVHIDADLIRRIKIMAIERSTTASSLVQAAVAEFLSRQGPPPPSASHSEESQCS
jgi:predicted transcriptional regulator